MPARIAPTAQHDRILDAARYAGSIQDQHRDLITAVPAAEPNRLHAVLSEHYPARVVLTGTLDRRLLMLESPESGGRWTVAGTCPASPTRAGPGRPGRRRRWGWTRRRAG
ncbi:MAG: hypothetical protein JO100_01850 [Pseudonocardia sp.]|nr:hypothetical protein [Pseudonocardia sp.]